MTKTMGISGMMCVKCAGRVQKALEAIPEVEKAEVSHEAGTAVITLRDPVSDETLRGAVEALNYQVTSLH